MFGLRPGKRAGPFSRRHVKNFTASLRRLYGITPYNCGVIKTKHVMNQQELNQLHGLLSVFKQKVLDNLDLTFEEERHIIEACSIVAEAKPTV